MDDFERGRIVGHREAAADCERRAAEIHRTRGSTLRAAAKRILALSTLPSDLVVVRREDMQIVMNHDIDPGPRARAAARIEAALEEKT